MAEATLYPGDVMFFEDMAPLKHRVEAMEADPFLALTVRSMCEPVRQLQELKWLMPSGL